MGSYQQMEPQQMGSYQIGPQQMGPQQMGPQQMGPQQMGPQYMGPQQTGPQYMRPQQMGPYPTLPPPPPQMVYSNGITMMLYRQRIEEMLQRYFLCLYFNFFLGDFCHARSKDFKIFFPNLNIWNFITIN